MPRRKRRKLKPEIEHTHLAVRVEGYEAHVDASVNHNVYEPQYAVAFDDDDPLYRFTAQLTITGTFTYPEERAGHACDLTIYGDDAPSRQLSLTLKDAQARDQHASPQYRTYRGRQIPVYNAPKGMGMITKVRSEPCWTAWIWVAPRFINDALVLLTHKRDLFLSVQERKDERTRWIQRLSLQTDDPTEE